MNQLSPDQCRAARVLLDLTQRQLAAMCGIRLKLVNSFESNGPEPVEKKSGKTGKDYLTPEIYPDEIETIQRCLEQVGVTFLYNGRGQPSGVRLTTQVPFQILENEQPMWPLHFRVARAWLNWTHEDLSQMADISPSTVRDFEKGRRTPHKQNLTRAELAIKMRGVRFLYNWRADPIGIEVVNGVALAA